MTTSCITSSHGTYLFVADVLGCEGYRPLHGQDSKNLKQIFTNKRRVECQCAALEEMLDRRLPRTILQDIPNNAEFIKVATAALSTELLLERDLDTRDEIFVPSGAQGDVGKTKHKDAFDHLFPKVMINAEGFILSPVLLERSEKLAR